MTLVSDRQLDAHGRVGVGPIAHSSSTGAGRAGMDDTEIGVTSFASGNPIVDACGKYSIEYPVAVARGSVAANLAATRTMPFA